MLRTVGYKLMCITPSCGFCIEELATALAVSIALYFSIPVSTAQCFIDATVGASGALGGVQNVQWLFLLRTCFGWAGVFFISLL